MRFGGTQCRWPLKTANRDQAATKARDIYLSLVAVGYEATIERFKPWTAEDQEDPNTVTVGQFIEAVRTVAPVRATTFTTYERKMRFLVSQIKAVESSRARYDYVNGGCKAWRDKVDATPLSELTPEKVLQWQI